MAGKSITCIKCPVGCRLTVEDGPDGLKISGYTCGRGLEYGRQEYLMPVRTVTSSVCVEGGVRRVCSVKTAGDVPKSKVHDVLRDIHFIKIPAPIEIGQVLATQIGGTDVDLVATAGVPCALLPGH